MSFMKKFALSVLSIGAVLAGALPGMARPATLTTDTNLRSGASLTAPVLEVLAPNGRVEVLNVVLGTDGSYWYYVRSEIEGTEEGWIRGDLARFEPSQKRYATLGGSRGDQINVRSAPSLDSKILHYGISGDLVAIEGSSTASDSSRWYRVKFPSNAIGWVRADLLSLWPEGCIIACPGN